MRIKIRFRRDKREVFWKMQTGNTWDLKMLVDKLLEDTTQDKLEIRLNKIKETKK